jgi:hypothetical protein
MIGYTTKFNLANSTMSGLFLYVMVLKSAESGNAESPVDESPAVATSLQV